MEKIKTKIERIALKNHLHRIILGSIFTVLFFTIASSILILFAALLAHGVRNGVTGGLMLKFLGFLLASPLLMVGAIGAGSLAYYIFFEMN